MGCGCSSERGSLSTSMKGQKHIMSPELREDAHEELGITLAACSLKGWRKTQEDTSSIVLNLGGKADMLGLGVFDGHSGAEASKYVAANLWDQVISSCHWADGDVDGALRSAFFAVDANMRRDKVCHGTTAVVAVITPRYLYIANCGDSRAVLCKDGVATPLSVDHKPGVYSEKARVIRCGGSVIPGEFGSVSRVTAPGAQVAMATSRSLGDFHFKQACVADPGEQVVSPAADVMCVARDEGDEFLILGTDGVWDVLSNQEVSNMLRAVERAPRPVSSGPTPSPPLPDETPSIRGTSGHLSSSVSRRDAKTPAPATTRTGSMMLGGTATEGEVGEARIVETPDPSRRRQQGISTNQAGSGQGALSTNGAEGNARENAGDDTSLPAAPAPSSSTGQEGGSLALAEASGSTSTNSDAIPAAAAAPPEDEVFSATMPPRRTGARAAASVGLEGSKKGIGDEEERQGDGIGGSGLGKEPRVEGTSQKPAFVPLVTSTLVRLITPIPPNPIPRDAGASVRAGRDGARLSPLADSHGGGGRVIEDPALTLPVNGDAGGVDGAGGMKRNSSDSSFSGASNCTLSDSDDDAGREVVEKSERHGVQGHDGSMDKELPNVDTMAQAMGKEAGAEVPTSSDAQVDDLAASRSHEAESASRTQVERQPEAKTGGPPISIEAENVCPEENTRIADVDVSVIDGGHQLVASGDAAAPGDSPVNPAQGNGESYASGHNAGLDSGGADDVSADRSGYRTARHGPVLAAVLENGQGETKTGAPSSGEAAQTSRELDGDERGGGHPPLDPGIQEGKGGVMHKMSPPAPRSTSTATVSTRLRSSDSDSARATPSSGNTPQPTTCSSSSSSSTPYKFGRHPAGSGSNSNNNSSGTTPKTPLNPRRMASHKSCRTPSIGGTPNGRSRTVSGDSSGGTPNTIGSRLSHNFRRSGSGLSLFKSGGSLSLSMSSVAGGKDKYGSGDRPDRKGTIGAVQTVLDRALNKGSQDNMTIIAVDLRGFLELSPLDSASMLQ